MDRPRQTQESRNAQPALSALGLGCIGVALAYFGYALGPVSLNILEIVGPAIFWIALLYFVFRFPFRDAAAAFSKTVRTSLGTGAFVIYVAVHLLLYGFLLDAVLASFYGVANFATSAGFFLATNVYLPSSVVSTVFDIAYNPVIVVSAPPIFSAALSFYSVAMALVIGALVVANIGETRELGKRGATEARAKNLVVLPAIGVVLGASCCLSVAGILTLVAPAGSFLTSPWVYYVTYFLFPCVAIAVLYLNLRATRAFEAGQGA